MSRRILVVGLGRFGAAVATGLFQRGCEVMAVDRDMEIVSEFRDRVSYALELDATDPEALRSVDAGSCRIAIVAIGEDFESAVLAVAALKECGVPRVVARAGNPRRARILRAVGADEAIEVETEVGQRLAESLAEESDRATERRASG